MSTLVNTYGVGRNGPERPDGTLMTGRRNVKETELWRRLQEQLGAGYYRVWASEFSLADLDQRSVVQALADGESCKNIWRAVWSALELPPHER